jgi:hypothetical protein
MVAMAIILVWQMPIPVSSRAFWLRRHILRPYCTWSRECRV